MVDMTWQETKCYLCNAKSHQQSLNPVDTLYLVSCHTCGEYQITDLAVSCDPKTGNLTPWYGWSLFQGPLGNLFGSFANYLEVPNDSVLNHCAFNKGVASLSSIFLNAADSLADMPKIQPVVLH